MPIPTEKLTNRFLVIITIITTDKMPKQHVACFLKPWIVLNLEGSIIVMIIIVTVT